MKRVYQLDEDDDDPDLARHASAPAAELVAFEGDPFEQPEALLAKQQQEPQLLENRVGYTIKDNKQYYELVSMYVVVYGHVKEGLPVSSLFLPNEGTAPEFDF
jgi:hypothetical protein